MSRQTKATNREWPDDNNVPNILEHHNDPLRELWRGGWNKLPRLHKVGLVVCLGFYVLFIFVFLGAPLLRIRSWSDAAAIAVPFGSVTLLLTTFYALLVWRIR